jgi:hypothetical protein
MDERVLCWLKSHVGEVFESPRKKFSKREIMDVKLLSADFDKIKIHFVGSRYDALPIYFWMFDRTIQYLNQNKDKCVRLGTKLQPPYEIDTIEGQIWQEPYPKIHSSYKVASHVCDILAKSGVAEYCYAFNNETKRTVQGIKLLT